VSNGTLLGTTVQLLLVISIHFVAGTTP